MNGSRFQKACQDALKKTSVPGKDGIGVLREKTLHAVLKYYFEPAQDNHEIPIGGFVADIVGENGIIEIQTGNLEKLQKKLEQFLKVCPVTVVYPVFGEKYLLWLDERTGETTKKRRSPKRGTLAEAVSQLYPLRKFLDCPNFTFYVVVLSGTEIRYLNGWSKDRKKGSSRCDLIPESILDEVAFKSRDDYRGLIPNELPDKFTVKQFGKAISVKGRKAYSLIHILECLRLVEKLPKEGRSYPYRLCSLENNAEEQIGDLTCIRKN